MPYDKNIGKLFSKHELLFLDQANSSSDPSQVLIQKFPITRTPLPPSSSLSNFTSCLANCLQISLANWNSLQHNPYNVLHWFPYFFLSHSATSHHKYLIYQNICNPQPSKFIIKLYTDHNPLWVKRATYHKAQSLRAASLSS